MSDEFRTRFGGECYPSILETNQADAEMEAQGFYFYGNAVPEDGAGFVRVYKRKPPSLLEAIKQYLRERYINWRHSGRDDGGTFGALIDAVEREEAKDG